MNKRSKHILLSFIFLLAAFLIVGCKPQEKTQLSVPGNVTITNNVVSWDTVENAGGYTVSVDGTEYKVQTTSYTILINQPGSYDVKVRADGSKNTLTSPWSTVLKFVVNTPKPIAYAISELFDDVAEKDAWNLGSINNMHDVKNGQLVLRHTGLVPYPSRGKHMKVTLSEYPYLAVKVDDVGGNNARWAIKILLPGDETSSRSVTPNDMTTSGIFFFDLTKVDGLVDKDFIEFDLYIYIIESENNYVKIDYIQSLADIPEVNNFNATTGITITNGEMNAEHGVLFVQSNQNTAAVVRSTLYIDTTIANMLDLFVSQIGESTSFSLKIDDQLVINESTKYGHFGLNLNELGIEKTGYVDIEFIIDGEMSIDRLANTTYQPYEQIFEDFSDETIYDLVTLSGSADVSLSDEKHLIIHKISALTGNAVVKLSGTTNFSTYPEFTYTISAIDEGASIRVLINGRLINTVTEAGNYSFDMSSIYQTGYRKVVIDFMLLAEGDATATISGFEFVSNEDYSMFALPEKGDAVETENMITEEGYNSDNWAGNATIFSRNGQIWIINSDFYSKGEVFGRNIDLKDYRYLNIKIDELTAGASWKIDVTYDVGLPGQRNYTIQSDNNATGTLTYDLYQLMNLTDETKITGRVSINFFIIGGSDKIAKIDFINIKQTPDTANEIINIKPVENIQVALDATVNVSAELKFNVGNVSIKVENELGVDVTSTVLNGSVFSSSVEGVYTVIYSFTGVETKERTITVTTNPVIFTENTSTTLQYEMSLVVLGVVLPNDGSTVTYQSFLGEVEVTSTVLSALDEGMLFTASSTGEYRIVIKSETTDSVEFTVTVVSGWVSEASGTNQNYVQDGKLVMSYKGGFYWPKHERTITVTADKPYLVVDVNAITGGTWKLDIDLLLSNAIAENGNTGLSIINLTSLLGNDTEKAMKFVILIVGSNVKLELDAFKLVSYEKVSTEYNSIIDVTPASNQTISIGSPVSVSAVLKYPVTGETVNIKVLDESLIDVTNAVNQSGTLTFSVSGTYTVVYQSTLATSKERTIIVLDDSEPILSTTNDLAVSIDLNESYALNVAVENPTVGKTVTYTVTKDGGLDDLSNTLIVNQQFLATETGVYTITASYEDALDLVQVITVVSGWQHETLNNGGLIESNFINNEFTLHYQGAFYWPVSKYFLNITTDSTPFVYFNVNSIKGGTWKLQVGDPYKVDVIAEGTKTGHVLIDLRTIAASAGYGETNKELTMTFIIYIVGGNVTLNLTPFELLTEAQVAQRFNQIVNVKPTATVTVLPNSEVNVSASLLFPIVDNTINITVKDEFNADVTGLVLVNGKFVASEPGIYTVTYQHPLAEMVTRTIEVVSPETPVITTTGDVSKTILVNETYTVAFDVENPVPGQVLSYKVFKDGNQEDIKSLVFNESTLTFESDTTGNYLLVVSYPNAVDLFISILVKTDWILETIINGGQLTISETSGVVTINYTGNFYWPNSKVTQKVTTDVTPYLVINVDSIIGGTWKLELGDPYRTVIISEGTTSGQIIIDLRNHVASAGYSQTNIELTMTLTVYVVGGNVTLKINSIQFLTQAEKDLLV